MPDNSFKSHARGISGPLTRAAQITPSDTTDLSFHTRAVLLGQGGDIAVRTVDGDAITLPALRAGVIYPIAIDRVEQTGTTAGQIVALA